MVEGDREPVFAPPWLAGNRSLGTLRIEPATLGGSSRSRQVLSD